MRNWLAVLVVLFSGLCMAETVCRVPKTELVDGKSYVCFDSSHEPIWSVLYTKGRLEVSVLYPTPSTVANVPRVYNPLPELFENGDESLSVTTTKDSTGKWISLVGNYY